MAEIVVRDESPDFHVTVRDGSGETEHIVRVADDYVSRLGLDHADRRGLVERSFEFLLEREPKESIMRSFDLSVIERYFPEYPDEINNRMEPS
ncbi:MAG: hypothetical protein WD646_04705 [Actinomycetota bacterium]